MPPRASQSPLAATFFVSSPVIVPEEQHERLATGTETFRTTRIAAEPLKMAAAALTRDSQNLTATIDFYCGSSEYSNAT